MQEGRQFASWCDQIGQRVAVQFPEKCGQCPGYRLLQHAVRLDRAKACFAEAWHENQIRLTPAHDFSDVDDFGWSGQPEATSLTAHGLDVTGKPKLMNHLIEVGLGNAVALRDLGNGDQVIARQSEIN
jgi:hypothetical protein